MGYQYCFGNCIYSKIKRIDDVYRKDKRKTTLELILIQSLILNDPDYPFNGHQHGLVYINTASVDSFDRHNGAL